MCNREEKLAVSATPTQLTEGIPPDAVGIQVSQFEAIAEQYGSLTKIAEVAELTSKHPIVERTIFVLGLQAAETYDQLIFNVLDAATNTYYPNGRTADTALFASDRIGYVDLVNLNAILMDGGARPIRNGDYVYVNPPQVYASLLVDPDFKAAHQLSSPDNIYKGDAGRLAGTTIIKSNAPGFAAVSQTTVGQTNKVFSSFYLGLNSYQISDLQYLQLFVTGPGGHTDALHQSRLIGWKFMFKALITNQTWIRRVRSSGNNSVNN